MAQFDSAFINAVTDLVAEVTGNGELLRVNRSMQVAMATTSTRRRATFAAFVHPEDLEAVLDAIQAPTQTQGRTLLARLLPPLSYQTAPSTMHILDVPEALASRERNDSRLVTIQRRGEALGDVDLEGERRRFETFFHNASDAVFIHDTSGQILDANDVAVALLGFPVEELRERTIGSLHPGGSSDAPKNVDLSVGEVMVFDGDLAMRTGEVLPVRTRVQKILLGRDPVNVSTVTDLRRERIVREQMVRAEQLEAVSRMAGALSHDFNNLLMVALAGAAELLEAEDLPPELREIVEDVHQTTEQASALASRLTGVARSQQPLQGVTDLCAQVHSMRRAFATLTRKEVEVTVDLCEGQVPIPLHESQVAQILTNLVSNAGHAIEGSGHVRISVTRAPHDEEMCGVLRVSDDGSGMSPEVLDRIFEPLYTTKGMGVGTGLGLASVQAILEQQGGVVDVQSTVGEGTTFELTFPVAETCAAPESAAASISAVLPGVALRGRVLVVDDMPAVRGVLTRLLTRWGFEVVAGSDGQQGLELTEMHPPGHFDLMITDMMMPGRSGSELTEAAWAHDPALRVIILTAFSTEFLPRGVNGQLTCLSKPVQPRRLKGAIDAILRKQRSSEG